MNDPRIAFGRDLAPSGAEQVIDALDAIRPIVHVGADAGPAGGTAAVAAFSMLGRMFPHATIDGRTVLSRNPWHLETLADAHDAFASTRPAATRAPAGDVHIGIGGGAPNDCIGIGGDDWTCIVAKGPQRVGRGELGLGLQAAAALVSADLLKTALSRLGFAHCVLPATFTWNLLDYRLGPAPSVAPRPPRAVRLAILGAGSVGSSVAAVIASTSGLSGGAWIVDGDSFDPEKNPFRYPASLRNEAGPKALWLAETMRHAGWEATGYVGSVGAWVASRAAPGFDGIAVSSVDGVDGRREVTDLLARTTISIGVAGLSLHAQHEVLGDGYACPFCDFVDSTPELGQAQVWAGLTGLSVERVTHLIVKGEPLGAADIDAAARANRISGEDAVRLVGRRLADLVGRVYAEATVKPSGAAPIRVAAPFVSWMGGVLAAAEVAKSAYGLPFVDRRIDIDLSGAPTGFTLRRDADRSGRCLCASAIRRRWMRRLYAVA